MLSTTSSTGCSMSAPAISIPLEPINWNTMPRITGKRKQRCFDTEPVFANIKYNHHFKRFMLRGTEKVTIETGLLALAHNLRKKAA